MRTLWGIIALAAAIVFSQPAQTQEAHDWSSASGTRRTQGYAGGTWQTQQWGETKSSSRRTKRVQRERSQRTRQTPTTRQHADAGSAQVLTHPAGCPRRAFCGCGAAVRVFGSPVRSLWTAASWLKFPAASPGPGMVAANRRHVMVIERMVGPNTAVVYDANSGRGLTRLHTRSLAGFSIRNPRG